MAENFIVCCVAVTQGVCRGVGRSKVSGLLDKDIRTRWNYSKAK
jgi:hypothetical protein